MRLMWPRSTHESILEHGAGFDFNLVIRYGDRLPRGPLSFGVYIDDLLLIDLMRLKSILLTSSWRLRLGKIANKGSVPLSVCYLA